MLALTTANSYFLDMDLERLRAYGAERHDFVQRIGKDRSALEAPSTTAEYRERLRAVKRKLEELPGRESEYMPGSKLIKEQLFTIMPRTQSEERLSVNFKIYLDLEVDQKNITKVQISWRDRYSAYMDALRIESFSFAELDMYPRRNSSREALTLLEESLLVLEDPAVEVFHPTPPIPTIWD